MNLRANPPAVLVTGAEGMLGRHVCAMLEARGIPKVTPSHRDFNVVVDPIDEFLQGQRLLSVINCAAYTAVDLAETHLQEARDLNKFAVKALGGWCTRHKIPLVQTSTDFVFDGTSDRPYVETDLPNPQSVYARTKLEGEAYVAHGWVVRTSWLFGDQGRSFPRTMIRAWLLGKELRVVGDQVGCPTYAGELARIIGDILEVKPSFGKYHATGPAQMSWSDFARTLLTIYKDQHQLEQEINVQSIRTEDWPTPAKRPAYSVLSNQKLIDAGLKPHSSLAECLYSFAVANPPEKILADN